METRDSLNGPQERRLVTSCEYVDRLLSDIESILAASATKSPFKKFNVDFSPAQSKVIQDYIARIRAQLIRLLEANAIQLERPQFGAIHSIRTNLDFVQVTLEELNPHYLRGYGEVPESVIPTLNGAVAEVQGLVDKLDAYLVQRLGQDLQERLERLDMAVQDVPVLKVVEPLISKYGLVEYRPALSLILERMESETFEIAVFGRVSSGKSSLLNHILQSDVLPVGVNPITSVPTRLIYGAQARATVWFADAQPQQFETRRLAEFVTEKHNPANVKRITRLVVELPFMKKDEGIVFVDTPGLGSLATLGTAESMAYLPQCDLGIVLINAGATITEEDISTVRTLYDSGSPAMILLSKADLLSDDDRESAAHYIAGEIKAQLGLELPVHPISIMKEQASLLENWFEHEIIPLRAGHRDLARQSLHRKIAALVDSVAAVLRAKLEKAGRIPEESRKQLDNAEAGLRAMAGKFSNARDFYDEASSQIRVLGPTAIAAAASATVDLWNSRGDNQAFIDAILSSSIVHAVTERTRLTRAMFQNLARDLFGSLQQAQSALGTGSPPVEAELTSCVSEMPRPDLGSFSIELRPSPYRLLGKRIAKWAVAARLNKQIGSEIEQSLRDYGSLFESWSRSTLGELKYRFDSYADTYRAQFERLGRDVDLDAVEHAEIAEDLERLLSSLHTLST